MKGKKAIKGALCRLKVRPDLKMTKREFPSNLKERVKEEDSYSTDLPIGWGNWSNGRSDSAV